ncbi:MAG TPA: hypothetical protein VGG48_19365 [Rhizomicrobium sp.]|jgi:hypothetical protein
MKKFALIVGLVALTAPGLFATSAQAQATRTWISGVGDDVNPCSRTAPCKTFAGAISKTAAGGEIDTLDPGGFGAVTVTKSMTLADESVGEAGILVAGTNGVTVNLISCPTSGPPADSSCIVSIRGLIIDGGPTGSNSLAGVKFVNGHALVIENCVLRNFQGGSPNGYGIQFTPSTSGTYELDVDNTTIQNNGQAGGGATIGGGVFIAPGATTSTIKATLTNVNIFDNTNGVRIDATGATGGTIRTTLRNVTVNGSQFHGISSSAGGATTTIQTAIYNSTSNNSGADGVVSNGTNVTTWLSGDIIMGNNIGVQVGAGPSGVLNSYKNNTIKGNVNDNTGVLTLLTSGD